MEQVCSNCGGSWDVREIDLGNFRLSLCRRCRGVLFSDLLLELQGEVSSLRRRIESLEEGLRQLRRDFDTHMHHVRCYA